MEPSWERRRARRGYLAVAALPIAMSAGPAVAGDQQVQIASLPPAYFGQQLPAQFVVGAIPAELLAQDNARLAMPVDQPFSSSRFVVWVQPPAPPAEMRGSVLPDVPLVRKIVENPEPGVRTASAAPLPPRRPALPAPALRLASIGPVPLPMERPSIVGTSEAADEAESAAAEAAAAETQAAEPPAKPIPAAPSRSYVLSSERGPAHIEALIDHHAERFDIPARLIRRVVWRESKYDPRARNGPYWGLMQIRVETARGLGFRGQPAELLDADTNMTYAVAYLANAYRVAGRNETRAVQLYAKGYYYEAKRKGMLGALVKTASVAN